MASAGAVSGRASVSLLNSARWRAVSSVDSSVAAGNSSWSSATAWWASGAGPSTSTMFRTTQAAPSGPLLPGFFVEDCGVSQGPGPDDTGSLHWAAVVRGETSPFGANVRGSAAFNDCFGFLNRFDIPINSTTSSAFRLFRPASDGRGLLTHDLSFINGLCPAHPRLGAHLTNPIGEGWDEAEVLTEIRGG